MTGGWEDLVLSVALVVVAVLAWTAGAIYTTRRAARRDAQRRRMYLERVRHGNLPPRNPASSGHGRVRHIRYLSRSGGVEPFE